MHAVLLPLFRFEVVGVNERVVGNVDDATSGVAKHLSKRHQLLDSAWVVVPKEVVEHFFCGEQQLFARFEVPAGQKQRPLKRSSGAPRQQNFQVYKGSLLTFKLFYCNEFND